jgi:hypothetical protein
MDVSEKWLLGDENSLERPSRERLPAVMTVTRWNGCPKNDYLVKQNWLEWLSKEWLLGD